MQQPLPPAQLVSLGTVWGNPASDWIQVRGNEVQQSCLKGAAGGGYGAKAAGRLLVFMSLKTARLTLRPQLPADAAAMFAILSDPESMRFWNRPAVIRLAVVEALIREQQAAMADGLCRYWTVICAEDAIGSVDLSMIESGSAELGFLLRRDCWGKGLATEAAAAVIAHGFGRLGLARLAAAVQTGNRAAARVLEKNAFICVQSRAAVLADGQSKTCDFYLRERD